MISNWSLLNNMNALLEIQDLLWSIERDFLLYMWGPGTQLWWKSWSHSDVKQYHYRKTALWSITAKADQPGRYGRGVYLVNILVGLKNRHITNARTHYCLKYLIRFFCYCWSFIFFKSLLHTHPYYCVQCCRRKMLQAVEWAQRDQRSCSFYWAP